MVAVFFLQSPWLRVLSCECLTVVNGVASPQVWFRWASGTPCLFPTWRMHPMPQWRTCYRMCTMWSRWKSSYTGQCFPCTVPTGPPHTVLFFPQATAVGTHRHTSSFFCRHPCTSFCVCVCVCVVSRGCVAVSHFKVCRIQSLLFFCVCVCACVSMCKHGRVNCTLQQYYCSSNYSSVLKNYETINIQLLIQEAFFFNINSRPRMLFFYFQRQLLLP